MASDQKLNIVVSAKDEASSKLKGLSSNIESSLKKVSIAAGIAGAGLVAFAKTSIDAFMEDEMAMTRLTTIAQTVTGATNEQIQALANQASALQQVGVVADDVTIAGQSQLASFALTTDQVSTLTGSLGDLIVSSAGYNSTQQDAINAANMMGKAIATGMLGPLERSGVVMTEAQKAAFELASQEERVAIMADVIRQNYGGLNEAFAKTSQGGLQQLKFAFGDLQENIGSALIPALTEIVKAVTPIIQKFGEWAQQNPELVAKIIMFTGALAGVLFILPGLIAGIKAVNTALLFMSANPIVLVIAAIAALVLAIIYLIKNWDDVKTKVSGSMTALGNFLSEKLGWMGELIKGWIEGGRAIIEGGMGAIKGAWESAWGAMVNVVDSIVGSITGTISRIVDAVKDAITWVKKLIGLQSEAGSGMQRLSAGGGGGKSKKAHGGNVYSGNAYTVGERGPETFVPSVSGQIISSKNSGSGGITVNVNVSGNNVLGSNISQFSQMIGDEIIKQLRFQQRLA